VNRLPVGAILADLKHRLSEIYDFNAAGSMLTLDHVTSLDRWMHVAREWQLKPRAVTQPLPA
jgi:hypothetical protein